MLCATTASLNRLQRITSNLIPLVVAPVSVSGSAPVASTDTSRDRSTSAILPTPTTTTSTTIAHNQLRMSSKSDSTSYPPLTQSPLFRYHTRARGPHPAYPPRFPVSDDQLDWNVVYPSYEPPAFTADNVLKHSPDPIDPKSIPNLSSRHSFYRFALCRGDVPSTRNTRYMGYPLNPFGRTGLAERGKLYYWGPNHAADCILIRRHSSGSGSGGSDISVLCIKRSDTGEWALIGGMLDSDETADQCIKREFGEEVLGIDEHEQQTENNQSQDDRHQLLDLIFVSGQIVYQGYVDDPRNTDHAWIETTAFVYNLPSSVTDQQLELFIGGSDATETRWIQPVKGNKEYEHLYASHKQMLDHALKQLR